MTWGPKILFQKKNFFFSIFSNFFRLMISPGGIFFGEKGPSIQNFKREGDVFESPFFFEETPCFGKLSDLVIYLRVLAFLGVLRGFCKKLFFFPWFFQNYRNRIIWCKIKNSRNKRGFFGDNPILMLFQLFFQIFFSHSFPFQVLLRGDRWTFLLLKFHYYIFWGGTRFWKRGFHFGAKGFVSLHRPSPMPQKI